MNAWVFRTTHDHIDLAKYVHNCKEIEHLAKPKKAFRCLQQGDLAFLAVYKTGSPYRRGGFDGRAIYAFAEVIDSHDCRKFPERPRRFLLPGKTAGDRLDKKANEPHARLRIQRVLDPDHVIRREHLRAEFPADHPLFRSPRQTLIGISVSDAHRIHAMIG